MYVNDVGGDGVYGSIGNHGPKLFSLYCKVYDDMDVPPSLFGAVQLTVLI